MWGRCISKTTELGGCEFEIYVFLLKCKLPFYFLTIDQNYLQGGAIQRGDRPNDVREAGLSGGGLNKVVWDCILIVLKNWVFLKLFILKRFYVFFFFKWCTLSCKFLEWQYVKALFKKKMSRRKVINPYQPLGLLEDLCIIMIFQ